MDLSVWKYWKTVCLKSKWNQNECQSIAVLPNNFIQRNQSQLNRIESFSYVLQFWAHLKYCHCFHLLKFFSCLVLYICCVLFSLNILYILKMLAFSTSAYYFNLLSTMHSIKIDCVRFAYELIELNSLAFSSFSFKHNKSQTLYTVQPMQSSQPSNVERFTFNMNHYGY